MTAVAVDYVRSQMKSPSSFKLVGNVDMTISKTDSSTGKLWITYDAANSYNAMIRGHATCDIAYTETGGWSNKWSKSSSGLFTMCYFY